jgi:hypothetical protein
MLSAAKHLGVASEMLRCAQHDNTFPMLVGKILQNSSEQFRHFPIRLAKIIRRPPSSSNLTLIVT